MLYSCRPTTRNFAQQVEISILNLFGGIVGIGISLLGLYLASLTDNSVLARAIPALFLAFLCFAISNGMVKKCSSSPHPLNATNVFHIYMDAHGRSWYKRWIFSIWSIFRFPHFDFRGHVLLCMLDLLAMVVGTLRPGTSSALSSLHHCLKINLEMPFGIEHHPAISNPPFDELLKKTVALNSSFA
ncbi:hypothetical protein GYMLUDRAFT_238590 [Collybiopsis luxurians FD-317 M1]|nr:hypothetical protein GYMLUDRAFT_238590 [Collybiopsis luxurians FD-317 M1]